MNGLKAAGEAIRKARTIAVSGHIHPDGDSIGSMLALGLGLEAMGKRVCMVSCDGVPKRYRALPGAAKIARRFDTVPDLAIAVDCGSKEMLGRIYEQFRRAPEILEIDHHDFRRSFGTLQLIDNKAAAVGEIIFELLRTIKVDITKRVAQNLITSIVVETDSFRLPNTRPLTLDICADLIRRGVNFYRLVDTVFWSKTPESTILSGICLSRSRFLRRGRLVWSVIRQSDFMAAGGRDEDVDAVPDGLRSIATVKIAVLFREQDDNTLRVSLRSKGRINVASVAECYDGGGHFDVAGCFIRNRPGSINEFLRKAGRLLD